jgi:hypothetical protein
MPIVQTMVALLKNPLASHLEYRNLGAELENLSRFSRFSRRLGYLSIGIGNVKILENSWGLNWGHREFSAKSLPNSAACSSKDGSSF